MDPDLDALRAQLARLATHAHAWPFESSSSDSQDSAMSVGTDSATLPQLALPLHSRRLLVARRLHLWFFSPRVLLHLACQPACAAWLATLS